MYELTPTAARSRSYKQTAPLLLDQSGQSGPRTSLRVEILSAHNQAAIKKAGGAHRISRGDTTTALLARCAAAPTEEEQAAIISLEEFMGTRPYRAR